MLKKLLLSAVLVVGLALGGCSTSSIIPPAPATPTVSDITTEQTSIAAFKGNASDYLNLGVEVSNVWCTQYLNALTQNVSYTDFAANEASQLGTLSTGIAAAAGTSTSTTAILGMLFPSLNQSLVSAGRMATAGADPGVVYTLVAKQHSAYLGALQAPQTVAEAVSDISGYAAICQPAGIRSAVLQSGMNSTVSATQGNSNTAPASSSNPSTPGAMKATLGDNSVRVNNPPVVMIGR